MTAGESAYISLRNDIIFGSLAPAVKLRLEPLRERYGASVPTLREVLNRLTSEGFVVAEGQKGFRVTPVSVKGLEEIAAARRLIESQALVDSFRRGDLQWESSVVGAHHRLAAIEEKMIQGDEVDVRAWKEFDREFHTCLISACGSDFLLRIFNGVFEHYLRYQMLALGFRGRPAADEHLRLLKAAIGRDSEGALSVLEAHIRLGVEQAIATGRLS